MKIDTQELRRLYLEAMRRRGPKTGHPSARRIFGLFDGTLSARKKARLIDHLTRCSSCFQEFEFILALERHKKGMIADLDVLTGRRRTGAGHPTVKDRNPAYLKLTQKPIWRAWPTRSWAHAVGLAIVVLGLILGLSQWTSLKNIFENKFRAWPSPKISLINPPPHRSVSRQSLYFQWTPLPGTEYYIFELFDKALAPIYKSQETASTQTALPRNISDRLSPRQPYYWVVTGMLASGKKAESDIGEFSIKSP
jgi:hypothetical protein